jgi:HEAT repeat protein
LLYGALCWGVLASSPALAREHDVLLRLLRDGDSFRVRARAALALGRTNDDAVSRALERALDDQHAAVRAAAAAALARVGNASSIAALERARRDPAPDVAAQAEIALRAVTARAAQTGPGAGKSMPAPDPAESLRDARFVVVVGAVRNDSGLQEGELLALLAQGIVHELQRIGRIAVFASHELDASVSRAIQRRKVPAFRLEGNLRRVVSTLQDERHAVRAEVSLLLLDEPGRNLRSMLRGAATGEESRRGPRDTQLRLLAHKALRNAVRSAMSNARAAIEAAAFPHAAADGDAVREGPAEAALDRSHRRPRTR